MKPLRYGIAGFALMVAFAMGCAAAAQLSGSEWRPTEIAGLEIPADAGIFVRFKDNGELVGHGGCNGFFGGYELTGDKIEIGPLGATRMACPDPIMEREDRFLKGLSEAKRFLRDRIDLSLTDDAGNTIIRLIQVDAD